MGEHKAPKHQPTIGLALIVKNEAQVIRGCIESCRGADEVSIVSTGCTDGTIEIAEETCKEVGVRYSLDTGTFQWPDPPAGDEPWEPRHIEGIDFSAARNRSLDMLSTDWAICLDADERLDPTALFNIKQKIRSVSAEMEVLIVLMESTSITQDLHGKDIHFQFWREKVLRNVPAVRFHNVVHEMIKEDAVNETLPNIKISYTPHAHTDRNITILQNELRKDPNALYYQYLAAREYFGTGHVPEAIYWLERYLEQYERERKNAPSTLSCALVTLSWSYLRMLNYQKARKYALEAFGVAPDMKQATMLLAEVSRATGQDFESYRWNEIAATCQNRKCPFVSEGFF